MAEKQEQRFVHLYIRPFIIATDELITVPVGYVETEQTFNIKSSTPSASTELNFYKCVKVGNIAYNITITESNFELINDRTFDFHSWSDTTTLKSRIWSTSFDFYRASSHIKNFDNLWYIVQTDERYRY